MTTYLFSLLNHLQPTFALYLSSTAERVQLRAPDNDALEADGSPWMLTM